MYPNISRYYGKCFPKFVINISLSAFEWRGEPVSVKLSALCQDGRQQELSKLIKIKKKNKKEKESYKVKGRVVKLFIVTIHAIHGIQVSVKGRKNTRLKARCKT